MFINRVRERLYNKDVITAYILIYLHHYLAIAKCTYCSLTQWDLKVLAYLLSQEPVGIPCKYLHLAIFHLYLPQIWVFEKGTGYFSDAYLWRLSV